MVKSILVSIPMFFRRLSYQLVLAGAVLMAGASGKAETETEDRYAIRPFQVEHRTAPIDPKIRWAGFRSRIGTYLPTDPYHYWRFDIRNRAEVQDAFWNVQAAGNLTRADWTGSWPITPGDVTQAWRDAFMRTYNLHRYYYMRGDATYVQEDADPARRAHLQAAALFQGQRSGGYKHTVVPGEFPPGFPYVDQAIVYSKIGNIGLTLYPDESSMFIKDPGNELWPGHRFSFLNPHVDLFAFGQVGVIPEWPQRAEVPTMVALATDTRTVQQSGVNIGQPDGNTVPPAPKVDPFESPYVYPYPGFVTTDDAGSTGVLIMSVELPGAGLELDGSEMKITVERDGVPFPVTNAKADGTGTSHRAVAFFTSSIGPIYLRNHTDHGNSYKDATVKVTISGIRFSTTKVTTPGGMSSRDGPAYLAAANPRAFEPHTLSWTYTIFDPMVVLPAPFPTARSAIANLSTRAGVGDGDRALISGFIVTGDEPIRVAIRAQGPSLAQFGISDPAADPEVQVYELGSNARLLGGNGDWKSGANWRLVQSFGLNPSSAAESVAVATLAPGSYTAIVTDRAGDGGIGIVEVFAIDAETRSRLTNVSTRAILGQGEQALVGGFILQETTTLVIRTQSPSLARFGLPGAPGTRLSVIRQSDQAVLATNAGWNKPGAVGNDRLSTDLASYAPAHADEAAQVITLPAGAYTALVESADGSTAVGIVEIFEVP